MPHFVLRYVAVFAGLFYCGVAIQAEAIPTKLLFKPPYLSDARLSPDGKILAALNHDEADTVNLVLLELGSAQPKLLRGSKRFLVQSFEWLGSNHLIYSMTRDKIYDNGVYLVERTKLEKSKAVPETAFSGRARLIGSPLRRPGNALLERYSYENDEFAPNDPAEVSLASLSKPGARIHTSDSLVRKYPGPDKRNILGYDCDTDGELALCYYYENKQTHALLFDAQTERWQPLNLDLEYTSIALVEADHQHLWITEYSSSAGFVLQRFDVTTNKRESPVATDRDYNLGNSRMFYSQREKRVAGLIYTQRRSRSIWFSPHFAEAQATLDQNFPDTDNILLGVDDREERFLFVARSDRKSGLYYLLDAAAGTLSSAGQTMAWLKGQPLRPVQPVSFDTRDGQRLEGYLTLPAGADASHPAPLIVLCHGGPAARDEWQFEPEVQFLASRGYAVFQPNYRGSSGYSPAISYDYRYDFRRMHDDVTDGTKAMIRLPMIDQKRVGIMGASFGGYLAVSGVAHEDGLYRCAVTNCGVFDWSAMVKSRKTGRWPVAYEILVDNLGERRANRAQFEKISPLTAVDKITVPVFIAHGLEDQVAEVSQSQKLAAALRSRKVPCETFFKKDEAHGFFSYQTNLEYYDAVERFLAAHLQSRPLDKR